MSLSGKIIDIILKAIDFKGAKRRKIKPFKRNNKYSHPPSFMTRKYNTDEFIIQGRKCFTLNAAMHPKTHIIYLHGGSYKYQAVMVHWLFMLKFLQSIDCQITFIDYPLAPEQNAADAVRMVMQAYEQIVDNKSNQKIVLMGDSAGGGLALVLAQQIKLKCTSPNPDKIVLLSPWLDVSMSSEISKELIDADLILSYDQLKKDGISYAGPLSTKDPLCSPIYGDSNDIGKTAVFTGTSDMLYVDAMKYKSMAESQEYDITFYEYTGMQHIWALLPIKESKEVIRQMIEFIDG